MLQILCICSLSLAGVAHAAEWSIPAEAASIRPLIGGGNLYLGGEVGEFVSIAQGGQYEFIVRASGSEADDVWPVMALSVDGMEHRRVSVSSADAADYSVAVTLDPGVYALSAAFRNDSTGLFEDRNLYVKQLTLKAPQGGPAPETSNGEAWLKDAQRRETEVIAASGKRIHDLRTGEASLRFVTADGAPVAGARVTLHLDRHAFLFGCNIAGWGKLKSASLNAEYKRLFDRLFNYATMTFYWRFLEPEKGKRDYDYPDQVLKWCEDHDVAVKGHPLLWARSDSLPPWSKGLPAEDLQREHVKDLLMRYQGRIGFWDVVNEPANEPGIPLRAAHHWAREYDPAAKLIVNEYGILAATHEDFYQLLEQANRDKVPFDAVGIQGHAPTDMAFLLDRVWQVLDLYAQLGKPLHITEFTPPSDGSAVKGALWRGTWTPEVQAEYAEQFYRVCFSHPAVDAISWWDFSDEGAWVKGGGMLTADMKPKPVYEALQRLIHEEWTTRVEGATDDNGLYSFRGYFGRYSGTVLSGGAETAFTFNVVKGARSPIEVQVP
ncbi:MAG: endo-1,4-beta-xylanase [Candidatus Hydrogenedentes bacterium]|nr:endo-1,4-beta-xylanase [Candidatus Hydrogenedentota bacterium]